MQKYIGGYGLGYYGGDGNCQSTATCGQPIYSSAIANATCASSIGVQAISPQEKMTIMKARAAKATKLAMASRYPARTFVAKGAQIGVL